jgi:hypothetical protein
LLKLFFKHGPHKYTLKLIVMEYCNGASLATLIEEPENMYGLQQDEFLLVLKHISKVHQKIFLV